MLIRRTVNVKPEPGSAVRDRAGVISRIAGRIAQCSAVLFCLLPALPASAQERGPEPAITQMQIENCLATNSEACPVDIRLRLIGSTAAQIEDLAARTGLFCELDPYNCPGQESMARLHMLSQSVEELIWGLPQYRISMLTMRNQTGVVDLDEMPLAPQRRIRPLEPFE